MKKTVAIAALVLATALGIGLLLPWQSYKEKGGVAQSYAQVYKAISQREELMNGMALGGVPEFGVMEDAGAMLSTAEYSKTNVQEEGVDEGDIVKSDGKYIYALYGGKLRIFKAEGENMALLGTVEPKDGIGWYKEIYLLEKQLVLIKIREDEGELAKSNSGLVDYVGTGQVSCAEIYSLSSPTSPVLTGCYEQDGRYLSSRMIGTELYLITRKEAGWDIKEDKPETYIPSVRENGVKGLVAPRDIYISPGYHKGNCERGYLVVSGMSITQGGKKTSVRAMLGYGGTIYASKENLYVAGIADIKGDEEHSTGTELLRFSLNKGKIELKARATVKGVLDDQFSMSESNGYFRLVTTVDRRSYVSEDLRYSNEEDNSRTNRLAILNMDLQEQGSIEGLAPGEKIYSCRFIGDIAYFVTFRQIDPLFAVDISNPKNPVLLSELKIPGFSDYLQPFGRDRLLGIGRDADPETGESGPVKLSMFNIKNPKAVSQENFSITKEQFSEALDNHKAMLVSKEKNIIAFPGESGYLMYSYNEDKGFNLEKALSFEMGGDLRGLYIGDYLYITGEGGLVAIDLSEYSIAGVLEY